MNDLVLDRIVYSAWTLCEMRIHVSGACPFGAVQSLQASEERQTEMQTLQVLSLCVIFSLRSPLTVSPSFFYPTTQVSILFLTALLYLLVLSPLVGWRQDMFLLESWGYRKYVCLPCRSDWNYELIPFYFFSFHGNITIQSRKMLYYYVFIAYVRVLCYVNTIL